MDVAIGPKSSSAPPFGILTTDFLRYDIVAVLSPQLQSESLDELTWFLGPSAVEGLGVSQFVLERMQVRESMQRIYTNHAAAVAEARNGNGVALVPSFAVSKQLSSGELVCVDLPGCRASGTWALMVLPNDRSSQVARELKRFVSTPRAVQAMLSGSGSNIGRFKPHVHITLWN